MPGRVRSGGRRGARRSVNENAVTITVTCPVAKDEVERDRADFWEAVKRLFCEALDDLRVKDRA